MTHPWRNTLSALVLALAAATGCGGDDGGEGSGDEMSGGETSGAEVCDSCAADEYCHESIIDAPSDFSCRPIPSECTDDQTCACVEPLICPDELQACSVVDGQIEVQCVEG